MRSRRSRKLSHTQTSVPCGTLKNETHNHMNNIAAFPFVQIVKKQLVTLNNNAVENKNTIIYFYLNCEKTSTLL